LAKSDPIRLLDPLLQLLPEDRRGHLGSLPVRCTGMNTTPFGRLARRSVVLPLAVLAASQVQAQATTNPPAPQGVLSLNASASVDVPHDWMSLSFQATREGSDAGVVQAQLKTALEAALAEARRVARPGQVEVQTGGFSIYPRHGSKGQISGWQGSTRLLVEGRDMAVISQLGGRITSMSIAGVGFSLSREAREQVESQVTAQAIARFRARAAEQAKAFGYAGYAVREVSVSMDQDGGGMPVPRVAMASARMAEDAPLPTEAGKGTVTATVSGSVQMR
jgi:predicted secreted protein